MAKNYKQWLQRFELYALAIWLTDKPENVHCATLLHLAAEEAIRRFNNFVVQRLRQDFHQNSSIFQKA